VTASSNNFIIISPVVGTVAIPGAGTAVLNSAVQYMARITFLKIE
jgi:hypothetical protein